MTDGFINIDDIGLVYLSGMTVKEADSFMRRKLNQIYSVAGDNAKSEMKLTLGSIRTIQVNILGEVAMPGTYYISSFSNVYHAVYRAGGVNSLGSLRDIQLVRGGKKVASVDVYEFLMDGTFPDDISLQEGDIVLVHPYESLVNISGNVKRPMFYEMKEGETVEDLVRFAGGFTGDAYKDNLRLIRRNGREYQVFTVEEPKYPSFSLMDGDALSVGAMLDRYANRLEIRGAVYRPGIYELGDDIATVSQLIAKAEGLTGDAFTNRAIIHREKEDLTLEVIPVDVKAILDGSSPDVPLKKNDALYIPSIHDLKDIGYVTVMGEVARPGQFVFAENTTLEDIIIQAGGLLESASTVKVDVSRRIKNPLSTEPTDTISKMYSFALKDGFVIDGEPGFLLEPYDEIMVRRSPGYSPQVQVSVTGEVAFAGVYSLTHKNQRISELVADAGGVTGWAYVKGARLLRRITDEERARMDATLETLNRGKDSIDISNSTVTAVGYYGAGIGRNAARSDDYEIWDDKADTITISDSTVNAYSTYGAGIGSGWVATSYVDKKTSTTNIAISGGTFSNAVLPEYCAAGYIPTANGDGTYGVKKVAHVVAVTLGGEKKELPFADAWLAANIGTDESSWTTEALEEKAKNGLAKWQCYLFGLDPNKKDAKVVATAGQGTDKAIPLTVANADASASPLVTGGYVTVAYVLMGSNDMGSNDGTAWTQVATSDKRDGLAIPLTGTTYKFYRVDVTVTSAEGN